MYSTAVDRQEFGCRFTTLRAGSCIDLTHLHLLGYNLEAIEGECSIDSHWSLQ